MRKYRTSAASDTRIDYGIGLLCGLGLFPETAVLAPTFETIHNELSAAYEARRSKRPALVRARLLLRFANYEVDQLIRQCSRAAEIEDGGRRGPISIAAFPDGVGPVVAPPGARQIPPTEELLSRMSKSKVVGMAVFSTVWAGKLQPALDKLVAAAKAHDSAKKAYVDAFQMELALRAEHLTAVDRLIGFVRAAFPGDRNKQDLVFPVVEESEGLVDEEAGAVSGGAGDPSG